METKGTIERQATYVGTHVIAEFFDCKNIEDSAMIKDSLMVAAKKCGATILGHDFHDFEPQGFTGYILLAESHISIHTWPEHNYAAVDAFTCGSNMNPQAAIEHLRLALGAEMAEEKVLSRGIKKFKDK